MVNRKVAHIRQSLRSPAPEYFCGAGNQNDFAWTPAFAGVTNF
jgi:hypothetical protein